MPTYKGQNIITCMHCGHQKYVNTGKHVSDYLITRDCERGKVAATRGIPTYSMGRFQGWECLTCFNKGEYSQAWDSFACITCEHWLDSACKCRDGECPYVNRPEVPALFDTPFGKGIV